MVPVDHQEPSEQSPPFPAGPGRPPSGPEKLDAGPSSGRHVPDVMVGVPLPLSEPTRGGGQRDRGADLFGEQLETLPLFPSESLPDEIHIGCSAVRVSGRMEDDEKRLVLEHGYPAGPACYLSGVAAGPEELEEGLRFEPDPGKAPVNVDVPPLLVPERHRVLEDGARPKRRDGFPPVREEDFGEPRGIGWPDEHIHVTADAALLVEAAVSGVSLHVQKVDAGLYGEVLDEGMGQLDAVGLRQIDVGHHVRGVRSPQ